MNIEIEFNDGKRRSYFIQKELVEQMDHGKHIIIETCHPDYGEVMIIKIKEIKA